MWLKNGVRVKFESGIGVKSLRCFIWIFDVQCFWCFGLVGERRHGWCIEKGLDVGEERMR